MSTRFHAAVCRGKASLMILLTAALAGTCIPAHAEPDGCALFAWPLTIERQWLTVSDLPLYGSGSSLPAIPRKGLALELVPIQDVKFPADPEKPSTRGWGGFVVLPSPEKPGLYQITLSDNAWIDVVQGGARLASQAHTGRPDCTPLRKSVRFQLGSAPVTIQVSGVPSNALKIAVRKVSED
jgi:hypothetical protein